MRTPAAGPPFTKRPESRSRPGHRIPRAILAVLAVTMASLPARVAGQAAPSAGAPDGISGSITDHTLLITAGHRASMRTAAGPGAGTGPTITCGWFVLDTSTVRIDILQEPAPTVGSTYLLWCWYAADRTSLPGHPVIAEYTGPGLPGDPADADDVGEFALASIDFAAPEQAISPAPVQIVGIESWLAVTSRLDYDTAHANAGPVWVSVRPEFRDVVWDLGNGDEVRCTRDQDATTTWDPARPDRGSACVYTYESAGAGPTAEAVTDGSPAGHRHDISATITWTILRRTFEQDDWRPWRSLSLTTTETVPVTDLQAVIA